MSWYWRSGLTLEMYSGCTFPSLTRSICVRGTDYMDCVGSSVVSRLTAVGMQAGRAGLQSGWLWKLLHTVAAYLLVSRARSHASSSSALEWVVLGLVLTCWWEGLGPWVASCGGWGIPWCCPGKSIQIFKTCSLNNHGILPQKLPWNS